MGRTIHGPIRRAVALLDLVTDHTHDEGAVIILAKDGEEQAIKFV